MGFDKNEIVKDGYREEFGIRSYEVDRWGRVSLPVLLNFLQEGASNNADALKLGISHLRELDRFWVLSRIVIRVRAYPRWGERVALFTWPSGIDRLFALREFRMTDERDRVILSASSAWLMLDGKRRRPVRIERLFAERGVPLTRDPRNEATAKLTSAARGKEMLSAVVRRSDLDLNDHVNSARYVQWVLDSYPEETDPAKAVSGCTINFLSEGRCGERMEVRTVRTDQRAFLHSVIRVADGVEVCRILLSWG
jgi:medium-chain acyl-[acyl-carrier-protein] hydrolase